MSRRNPMPRNKAYQVFDKTKGKCTYCGCDLPEDTIFLDWGGKEVSRRRNWHVDHVLPVCKGGTDDMENLVPSCSSCNHEKGSK